MRAGGPGPSPPAPRPPPALAAPGWASGRRLAPGWPGPLRSGAERRPPGSGLSGGPLGARTSRTTCQRDVGILTKAVQGRGGASGWLEIPSELFEASALAIIMHKSRPFSEMYFLIIKVHFPSFREACITAELVKPPAGREVRRDPVTPAVPPPGPSAWGVRLSRLSSWPHPPRKEAEETNEIEGKPSLSFSENKTLRSKPAQVEAPRPPRSANALP